MGSSGLAMTHFFQQASIDEKCVIARPDPNLFSTCASSR